jgi:predicted dithiol-disulfide oxidoreductase (DUF899 family)
MQNHPVVSREQWLAARRALLVKEKQATQLRDRLNAERLALPWVKVDKRYCFEAPEGNRTLPDLFDGRSQLLVYHFMLGPGWAAGCPGCSFLADHLDGALPHLNHHDVTLTAVSRAPLAEIEAYKTRMGWRFPWVSAFDSDFNFDYRVSFTRRELENGQLLYNFTAAPVAEGFTDSELPGLSAFFRDQDGDIFHTYSSYARGPEELIGTLMILDRAPLGRNEKSTMDFVRRHDEYQETPSANACCAGPSPIRTPAGSAQQSG